MSEITYIRGDATAPSAKGVKVIAHVCNDIGGWGKGFVLALSRRWPEPEAAYRAWHRDRASNDFGLGAVQVVPVDRYVWVANMIGQRGIRWDRGHGVRPRRLNRTARGVSRTAVGGVARGAVRPSLTCR